LGFQSFLEGFSTKYLSISDNSFMLYEPGEVLAQKLCDRLFAPKTEQQIY
jgi:hypothetical protein